MLLCGSARRRSSGSGPAQAGHTTLPMARSCSAALLRRLSCRSGFFLAFGPGRREMARSQQSVGRHPQSGVPRLVDGVPRPGAQSADRDRLQSKSDSRRAQEPGCSRRARSWAWRSASSTRKLQQGNGSVTYIRPSHADTTQFPVSVIHNFWRDSLGLTVNWELDFWGKFRRAIESADAAYLASIANYDYVLVTLLGDVATTYIGIRTLQTQIEIARENIVKQKKALAIARGEVSRRHRDQARRLPGGKRPWANRIDDPAADDPVEPGLQRTGRAARHAAAADGAAAERARAGSRCRRRPSRSAFPPISSAAGRISAPPNWRRWRRARKSASPRPISIRRSA